MTDTSDGSLSQGRTILAVFAHPDDETTTAGGTLARYAAGGADVHVITATRGELGTLGADGNSFTRQELPDVREAELRSALELLGTNPPVLLGYRDQEVAKASHEEVAAKILEVMDRLGPEVVITWGPTGISGHTDHISIHQAAIAAFHDYRAAARRAPRLFYVAIPKEAAREFGMEITGPEGEPNVVVDVAEFADTKIRALRSYRSQQDAQEVADMMEARGWNVEAFHQVYPAPIGDAISDGLW